MSRVPGSRAKGLSVGLYGFEVEGLGFGVWGCLVQGFEAQGFR